MSEIASGNRILQIQHSWKPPNYLLQFLPILLTNAKWISISFRSMPMLRRAHATIYSVDDGFLPLMKRRYTRDIAWTMLYLFRPNSSRKFSSPFLSRRDAAEVREAAANGRSNNRNFDISKWTNAIFTPRLRQYEHEQMTTCIWPSRSGNLSKLKEHDHLFTFDFWGRFVALFKDFQSKKIKILEANFERELQGPKNVSFWPTLKTKI